MQSLRTTALYVVIISFIGYFTEYFCHIYLARVLSPSDYGDFAVALSLAIFWSFVAELGSSKIIPKYIPLYQDQEDMQRASGLLRSYFYITILLGIFIAIGGSLLGYVDVHFIEQPGQQQYHPLVLALWFLPLMAIARLASSLLKSHRVFILSDLPQRIIPYALLIVFLWLFAAFKIHPSDWLMLLLFGLAYLIVIQIYFLLIYKFVPLFFMQHKPYYEIKEWLRLSIPIMFSLILFMAMKQIDLIMVEILDSREETVGFFSAAIQSVYLLILVYTSLGLLFSPFIGEAVIKGRVATKKVLAHMFELTALFCLPLLLALILAGHWILSLFGAGYTEAYPALVILAIGLFINALIGGYLTFLQFSGNQIKTVLIQLLALILDILLNIILIPRYSITGAAIASATSLIIMCVWLGFEARKRLQGMNNI